MKDDRAKHKILPPSKFGLIQITRQRVRPEINIKTKEENPSKQGEVDAPIMLIDRITTDLQAMLPVGLNVECERNHLSKQLQRKNHTEYTSIYSCLSYQGAFLYTPQMVFKIPKMD